MTTIKRIPVSISELEKHYDLPRGFLERECTDEHARHIATWLDSWEQLAYRLGLTKPQVEAIMIENRREDDRRAATLMKWKESFAFKATNRIIIKAFLASNRADLACKMCELILSLETKDEHTVHPQRISSSVQHQGFLEPTSPQNSINSDSPPPFPISDATSKLITEYSLTEKIEIKFSNLVEEVEDSFTKSNVPLDKLQRIASHLPVDLKGEFGRLFEKKISKIHRAKSVQQLFAILSYFWDYLQPDLLIYIVHRLDVKEARTVMDEYENELDFFRKKVTLLEYVGKRRCNLDESDFKKLSIRLGNEWHDKTLHDLDTMRFAFADKFSLLRLVPKLNGVKSNSITAVFLLPKSVNLNDDQLRNFFQSYNALQVVVDGVCIFDVESLESTKSETSENVNDGVAKGENQSPNLGIMAEEKLKIESLKQELQASRSVGNPAPQVKDWTLTVEGKQRYGAFGSRDILLIVSSENLQGPDIVPRRDVELTKEDIEKLQKVNIPPEEWKDDASIIVARYKRDKTRDNTVIGVERSKDEKELTREYVLERLEKFMMDTRAQGVVIHYTGPGRRNTGDWCFEDGYVSFRDLAKLYCAYFKGRVLSIHTDCSYSGSWGKDLMKFLAEQGVRPCMHSAREKGILIKVIASCKSTEIPYRLFYPVRAVYNDKNTGMMIMKYSGSEIAQDQHVYIIDSTWHGCNAALKEPCTFSPEYTWERRDAQDRISLVRTEDCGEPVWYYVLLNDNEVKIKEFKELSTQGANLEKVLGNVSEYGQVIKSGGGKDPPNDIKEWMKNNYDVET